MNKINLLALACLLSGPSVAADVKVNRYALVNDDVSYAQKYPLETVIDIKIPSRINSVKGAIEYVLLRSGYTLLPAHLSHPDFTVTLKKPLPQVHRRMKMVSIKNAIKSLAGEPYVLIVDPVTRQVTFNSQFKHGGRQ
ncbi:hypothetical protein [Motilimonas pumila]|uniref:Pili assembly chaperone n=1 Tax=Motilimonas pumila TaxID=2303987 RepID=A0A418YA57_9GAMM|nr:hypothetical protein [Motilimonas pumila]RJG38981.1 hypothetical protein D1Z90_18585 [Motilimonas pumila]